MLALIAAVAENNCIGKNNSLPWYLPEDLKRFKALTTGKIVIMGRKTWDSLPAKFRPLPNRKNVVITRQTSLIFPSEVEVYSTLEAALGKHANEEVFIIGGGKLYAQTIERADRLYITQVHQLVGGDVFFPTIDPSMWKEVERENHEGFSFVIYDRI